MHVFNNCGRRDNAKEATCTLMNREREGREREREGEREGGREGRRDDGAFNNCGQPALL